MLINPDSLYLNEIEVWGFGRSKKIVLTCKKANYNFDYLLLFFKWKLSSGIKKSLLKCSVQNESFQKLQSPSEHFVALAGTYLGFANRK
jgi:hypothetical protein